MNGAAHIYNWETDDPSVPVFEVKPTAEMRRIEAEVRKTLAPLQHEAKVDLDRKLVFVLSKRFREGADIERGL